MVDDKKKPKGSSGSGKSPTKFMERPDSKPAKKEEPPMELSHPEFIEDDLAALESQEKDDEQTSSQGQVGGKPKQKSEPKPDPKKIQEPEKRESSSDDLGDCACI